MGKRESKNAGAKDSHDSKDEVRAMNTSDEAKSCSRCGTCEPDAAFYAERDNICKECKKAERRERYVSKGTEENAKKIAKVISFLLDQRTDEIANFNIRLEGFLKSAS